MLECNVIKKYFAHYICLHGYIHFIYLFNPNTKYRDMYRIPQINQNIQRYTFLLILASPILWRNLHLVIFSSMRPLVASGFYYAFIMLKTLWCMYFVITFYLSTSTSVSKKQGQLKIYRTVQILWLFASISLVCIGMKCVCVYRWIKCQFNQHWSCYHNDFKMHAVNKIIVESFTVSV